MLLLTLPDTPIATSKGLAHLLIVGVCVIASLIGIIILALTSHAIPGILEATSTLGVGYLIGANVVNNGK